MIQDTVVKLIQPAEFSDPLTEVLREGARALLAQAVEAEVTAFLSGHTNTHTEDGRQRLVRHGHRRERAIMTSLGPVPVRAPRIRDRTGAGESRIRFTSAILPPYARRSKSLEVLIPILYLKGISSGDFEDALSALGCRSGLNSRWPTAHSVSGKPLRRSGPRRAASAVGCTRPPMSSTNCRRASSPRPNAHFRTSGWPRPKRRRWSPSMPLSRPTESSTTRRSRAS